MMSVAAAGRGRCQFRSRANRLRMYGHRSSAPCSSAEWPGLAHPAHPADRSNRRGLRRAHPMHRVWMPFDRQMQVGKSRRSGRTSRTRPALLAWLRVPWASIAGKSPLRLGAAARDRGGRCGENDRLHAARHNMRPKAAQLFRYSLQAKLPADAGLSTAAHGMLIRSPCLSCRLLYPGSRY